jgi:nucleoside-diphosphate-sugar epimerase
MIGSHVARELVKRECHTVYGLVRPRSNLDTLIGILDKVSLVTGDITDGPRMLATIEEIRPYYIYHLAAQAINGISYDLPELTLDTNVIGTMNILEAVRRSGCRILLAGSSTEYGKTADIMDGKPIPEDASLDPVSPYGISKLTTEKMSNQYYMSFGVQVITARFFIQVGVGGTDSLAIHQFFKQIALAEAGFAEPVLHHGNLNTARDMTDCRDSAPVVVSLAEKGKPGEAYNIGSGMAMTIQELLDIAFAQSKIPIRPLVDASRFRAYDEKTLLPDNKKIRDLTGWVPDTDMRNTVSSILEYWRRHATSLYIATAVNTSD